MVGLWEDGLEGLNLLGRGVGRGSLGHERGTYILRSGFRAFLRNPLLLCLRMLAGLVVLKSRSCLLRLLAGLCAGACEAASFLATLLWE